MEPDGDPEARIRDLERPLADRAQANELGTTPYESAPEPVPPYPYGAPPQADPYQAQPYPQYGSPYPAGPYGSPYPDTQYGSPYYSAPQRVVHKRSSTTALWLIPLVVVGVVVAGIVAVVAYFNLGSPDSYTPNPAPPISGGGGQFDGPPKQPEVPSILDPDGETITVAAGGSVSIGGVGRNQTVICDDGAVNISGINNTIEIQGTCATVAVSGVENIVTVEAAGSITASGFDNRITYLGGNPETSQSGSGNVIEAG